MNRPILACLVLAILLSASSAQSRGEFDGLIARHAGANGLPESLVRRVIMRESRYNPSVVSRGNYGLMQIRLGTARGLGYRGTAAGLLDPDTNMTYAVRYLAGAYKAAGGNHDRAIGYYQRGYYHQAKRGESQFSFWFPGEIGSKPANRSAAVRKTRNFLTFRADPAR